MTPPAPTHVARRNAAGLRAPARARRSSGPAPAVSGGRAVAAPPLGLRVARGAARLPDARVLDRLIRGRAWIAIIAVGLMGIVFMQVSLLKLNTGIGRAVQSAQTLERQNTELRTELSRLGGGERVQDTAAAMGMTMPGADRVRFVAVGKASAATAAARISAPGSGPPVVPLTSSADGTAIIAPAPGAAAAQVAPGTTQVTPAAVPAPTPQAAPAPTPTTAPGPAAAGGVAATPAG